MANDFSESIGGYPLLDDGTPFPGGKSFTTKHSVSGTPLILRRYRSEWFAPADSLDGFHDRARSARGVEHPNLGKIVDAGFIGSDVYAVLEPVDGATLETLVKEIGPMPAVLAVEFTRQVADALKVIHDRGLVHGDVRPAHVAAGPLVDMPKTREDGTPMQRPAENATATLTDFGLIPKRPSGREWASLDPLATKPLGFLAPERTEYSVTSVATDIYGLGATLFFMLTGRAPFVANSADGVINAIETTQPAPLATLRPDIPTGLVEYVMKLIARDPSQRPQNAAHVAKALTTIAEPEPVVLTAAPPELGPLPASENWQVNAFPVSRLSDPNLAPAAEDLRDAFASAHSDVASSPRAPKGKSKMTEAERAKLRLWLWLGAIFWLVLAPILWLVLLSDSGCFKKAEKTKPDSSTRKRR